MHLDLLAAKDRVQIDPNFVFDTTILSWEENLYPGLQGGFPNNEFTIEKIRLLEAGVYEKE